jgi:hypothetical protein
LGVPEFNVLSAIADYENICGANALELMNKRMTTAWVAVVGDNEKHSTFRLFAGAAQVETN